MGPKPVEPDDPLELVGVGCPGGDAEQMARCLVEEYVRLGVSDAQLLALFRSPFYAAAHALYRARGEAWIRGLVAEARAQWGYPRFTTRHPRE